MTHIIFSFKIDNSELKNGYILTKYHNKYNIYEYILHYINFCLDRYVNDNPLYIMNKNREIKISNINYDSCIENENDYDLYINCNNSYENDFFVYNGIKKNFKKDNKYINKINEILNYDLYIFDFDGTIMDTEKHHCMAWNMALNERNSNNKKLSLSNYFKFFHTLDSMNQKIILKNFYNVNNYDEIYQRKQYYYNELIKTESIDFIEGAESFLKYLIENNKKYIIVTNTSIKYIETFQKKYPILKEAYKIYTKENFFNRKPNPECYIKVLNDFPNEKKIGFEDSYGGMHALYQVTDIQPIYIFNSDYYYTELILDKYPNIIVTYKYNINELNENIIHKKYNNNENHKFIYNILDNNINELKKNYDNMYNIINSITLILKNINSENHIYLTGMGKSGYICKKSASTWQSLSIKASYIDLPNLPHGDFGIFRDNDILLLISNGGNTDEIIYILKYIKENLKKKINIISIVANKNTDMEKYSNFTYVLNNIIEADNINMTPSTSSIIFMSLLDGIGINLRKDITKEEFKLYHPSGSLGKR